MFLKTFTRALLAQPIDAWHKRRAAALQALALRQCDKGDRQTALVTLKKAANLDPRNPEVRAFLAVVLLRNGATDPALDHLRIAHDIDPRNGNVLKLLVQTLVQTGRVQKALTMCEAALRRDRNFFEAWASLGHLYRRTHRSADALACFEHAAALRPDDVDSLTNRAIALQDLGRVDEAMQGYEAALAIEPENPLARFHRSLALLSLGQYAHGWTDYELRLLSTERAPAQPLAPRWDGSNPEGRSIVVRAEQGLGDEIMFASCLPQLIDAAAQCTLECSAQLSALFTRSFPKAKVRPTGQVDTSERHDVEVPLGSLPLYYRKALNDFPRHNGYLHADPVRTNEWRSKLYALGPGLKIGISWRGGTALSRTALRSIPLEEWTRVFAVHGVRFVSLQYGSNAASEAAALARNGGAAITHWQEAIDDYDETAALVAALDLTISVCTAVVHLAGALGRPVWVLTPQAAEWRYGMRGEAMPWYPSARLFRQDHYGDWDPVLRRVASELHALQQYSFGGAAALRRVPPV